MAGGWGAVPPGFKAFLSVTDNRRSRLDSPFCIINSRGNLNLVNPPSQTKQKDKQCSGTDDAAITDLIFCHSTNQSFKQPNYKSHKKDLARCPPLLF